MNIDAIYKKLLNYLESVPIAKPTFQIKTINNGKIDIQGKQNDDFLIMDQVNIGDNVETKWTIQNKSINFMVCKGSIKLYYRINNNIHSKELQTEQSLRIFSGLPFMIKTFEQESSVLLISMKSMKSVKSVGEK